MGRLSEMNDVVQGFPKKPVITFGEPLVACIPQTRGTGMAMCQFSTESAGAELNTAIGLARLNVPVAYAATVGSDPFGRLVCRDLGAEGVDASRVTRSVGGQTGVLFKQWRGLAGDTDVYYYRSGSPMAVGEWDVGQVHRDIAASVFCWLHSTGITWMIGEQTRAQASELLQLACNTGMPISFDVNVRLKLGSALSWREMVETVCPFVTWILLGDSEAYLLYGTREPDSLEERFRERGFAGQGVIIKQGDQGATAVVRGVETKVDAWPISQVMDTVGAGDGFNAGWIAGTLLGWELQRSLRLGALVGAYAVTSAGDSSGYPYWEETVAHIDGTEGIAR